MAHPLRIVRRILRQALGFPLFLLLSARKKIVKAKSRFEPERVIEVKLGFEVWSRTKEEG
jgi:hypothetical protein